MCMYLLSCHVYEIYMYIYINLYIYMYVALIIMKANSLHFHDFVITAIHVQVYMYLPRCGVCPVENLFLSSTPPPMSYTNVSSSMTVSELPQQRRINKWLWGTTCTCNVDQMFVHVYLEFIGIAGNLRDITHENYVKSVFVSGSRPWKYFNQNLTHNSFIAWKFRDTW